MIKISIKQRLLKIGLLSILILVVFPGVCLGAYGGLNYYQAKSLVGEADSLVRAEKFDQAIEKYALAEAKWSPRNFKTNLSKSLLQAQKLKEEKEFYEKGVKYFDDEKWETAKEAFQKITNASKYYNDAQDKLRIIEQKLAQEKKELEEKIALEKKAKTQVMGIQTTNIVPIASPLLTPQPTANPNKDSICRNEAELYKIREREKGIESLKSQRPELFWTEGDWLSHGYSQADLPHLVPVWQNYYKMAMSTLDNAAQQAYLAKYNECLLK